MKFTKIRLVGLNVVELPIVGALPSDPYILKAADGLGPPEVDVSIASTLNTGGVYQGRRPQSREPVLRIGLNPDHGSDQTAAELRTSLYGMLTPGSVDSVKLEIVNQNDVIATTTGYVKKLEIAPFSQTPEVQLTMGCLQPYLEAPSDLYVTPGGTFSAPEVDVIGTAETGFHMELTFSSDLPSGWSLTDAMGKTMNFEYPFASGDKLIFDTRPGSRNVWVTRILDLLTVNILYTLSADSTWHMLHGQTNFFTASSPSYTWNDVYYRPKYWGV